jgi:iron(III) transport system ATP-binding protein
MNQQIERLTNSHILEVEDICCDIGGNAILKNLSFKVPAGSFCCLLGKSGCGKTTLFRALSGLQEVQQGQVSVNGRMVIENGAPVVLSQHRKIGLVFQDYTLFPHLSVRDNLLFGAPECSRIEQQEIVNRLLTLIDLEGYQERFPHELSGGQQQRVALARTLASDPLLVLLDEPFSNLEQEQRLRLAQQVKHILKEQSISALLVTHDQQEAFAFADYIGIIIDGELVQWGTPEDIYYRPQNQQVAEFIGSGNWYDCQCVLDETGKQKLATPFGVIDISTDNKLLSEKNKSMLQGSDKLQIFLRQENIYLPVNQQEFTKECIDDICYTTPNNTMRHFPIIKWWQVTEKYFAGFLSFVDLKPVLEIEDDTLSKLRVNVFIRSNREIMIGQKVRVELEVGELILRSIPSPQPSP